MKILLYVNSHLPRIGGRELVVHNLAIQYQRLGHEVIVAGPGGWWTHRRERFDYEVRRWPSIGLLPRDVSQTLALLLTRATTAFDVVHAHSTYPTGYIATKLRRWLDCPIVITPHGEDINVVPELGFGQRLDPTQDRKIRFAVNAADRVTSISDTITSSLLDAGVEPSHIVSISNGVDVDRFDQCQKIDIRRLLDFPPDAVLVTTIGNYHKRKGHEVLIDALQIAIRSVPSIRLVIVGKPSDELRSNIEAKGLAGVIRLTGMLPTPRPDSDTEDVLAALLQNSAIYVSAGTSEGAEGLSLALLEGMAAGACPVATAISGNRDIIQNDVNGLLVPPSDAMALADRIIEVASSSDLRTRLGTQARLRIADFGWNRVAEQYLDLYESLIHERRPAPGRN